MKIAVFSTTDVQRWYPPDFSRRLEVPQSTGVVEAALALGYTVYVASTRMKLGLHDQWWVALVGEANVFLANDHGDAYSQQIHRDRNAEVSSGWSRLYEALGEEWPTWEGEPCFWTSARQILSGRGYAEARDFLPKETSCQA